MRDSGTALTFLDTICSYVIDHIKVVLHVNDTFYCAVTYHVLELNVR